MVWTDYLTGQELYCSGVLKDPRRKAWNFVGATAVYNTSTQMWDITTGGGGGSGHTIQDEGVSLTQRSTMDFVGPNVTVTDTGSKTQISIPAISLAGSGVTGTLTVARGGTGLGALGTALQSLRVNAGATALEYYTPSAGLTAPTNPGDDTKVAVASAGNLTYAFIGNTQIAAGALIALSKLATQAALSVVANGTNASAVPTAIAGAADEVLRVNTAGTALDFGTIATGGIADDAVTYAKLQNVSAASRVLGRGSAAGAGNCEELTCGVGVRVNATAIELTAALAPMATLGTALQQLRVNAGATALEYFSPANLVVGTNLTDASVTKNVSDGTQFTLPASTLTTTRTLTLGTSGTPELGEMVEILVFSQGSAYNVANGGPLGGTMFTIASGTKRVVHAQWNGTDWVAAGLARLA